MRLIGNEVVHSAVLRKALETMPFVTDVDAALVELVERTRDIDCLVETIFEQGVVIAENNRSQFVNACTVIHIYNQGSRRILKALKERLIVFAIQGNMTRIQGYDINDSAKAFGRLFAYKQWRAQPVGTFFEFVKGA